MFTLRLMACMGAAGLVSEVLPLQRSYWVPLTVAIVGVVGLAGFEPATSATQNCYEPRTRMLALH